MAGTQWQYETAQDIDQTISQRLIGFPRQPDMLIYGARSLMALVIRGWLHVYHGMRIDGRENLPAEGSFIVVCNHSSHLDALCLLSAIPLRKLHRAFPAAAQDYFFVSFHRSAIATVFINAMPFSRSVHLRQSLDLCRQLLANAGNILILFPEGTRTKTGELGEFRAGIGSLAARCQVPIVPCALRGAFEAWPKGAIVPRPRRLRLVIGKPRTYTCPDDGRETVHRIARELHDAVKELL